RAQSRVCPSVIRRRRPQSTLFPSTTLFRSIGNVAQGGTSNPVPINATCSDTLDASEPDTATLSCFCTADLNPNFKATAKDSASLDCQRPGLTLSQVEALHAVTGYRADTIKE